MINLIGLFLPGLIALDILTIPIFHKMIMFGYPLVFVGMLSAAFGFGNISFAIERLTNPNPGIYIYEDLKFVLSHLLLAAFLWTNSVFLITQGLQDIVIT